MLKRFANGNSRAVSEILTGYETWIYHYDAETKWQSKKQSKKYALPPTKARRIRSFGKQLWAILFRASGFVKAVPLEDRKTVTADWYTTVCFSKVFSVIESNVKGPVSEESCFTMIMRHLTPHSELVSL